MYLFNSPVIQAQGMCTKASSGVEDQFILSLLLENGLLAANKTSIASQTKHMAYLYGEKGYIEIPSYWKAREAVIHFSDSSTETLSYPCDHELVYEIDHVSDCIRRGLTESPIMTETMTVSAIRILNELKNSF